MLGSSSRTQAGARFRVTLWRVTVTGHIVGIRMAPQRLLALPMSSLCLLQARGLSMCLRITAMGAAVR